MKGLLGARIKVTRSDELLESLWLKVWIYTEEHNGKFGIVDTVIFHERELDDLSAPISPPLQLDPVGAQVLMDSLWQCGVRPSNGEGSAGQLAAVKYHLEDMRRLVFQLLGKEKGATQ